MKSRHWTLIACASAFSAGCAPEPAVGTGPLFCDVEQPRRFSAGELEARLPYTANLRSDLATNELGEKWCGWRA